MGSRLTRAAAEIRLGSGETRPRRGFATAGGGQRQTSSSASLLDRGKYRIKPQTGRRSAAREDLAREGCSLFG